MEQAANGLEAVLSRLAKRPPENPQAAAAWEARMREQDLLDRGIPKALRALLLDREDEHGKALVSSPAYLALQGELRDHSRLVVLWGPCGTGKTVAAAWWLAGEATGLFVSASDYGALAPWDGARRKYHAFSRLVIDDLGTEDDRDRGKFERLISDRHAELLTTVITTNLTPQQILDRYDARIISRLREVGSVVPCKQVIRPGERA